MNYAKYQLIKVLFIDKISTKIADKGLSYSSSATLYSNYKTELLKLDSIKEVFLYAEKVWNDVHRLLGPGEPPPLIEVGSKEKEEIKVAENFQRLLMLDIWNVEQELSQKQQEINNSQNKINSLQNDLTTKDSELTNQATQKKDLEQQVNSLKKKITSLSNEKKEAEQSKSDLLDKLSNSVNQKDYESIKEELEKEKNKDIERERERERERAKIPRTQRTPHQRTMIKRKNLNLIRRLPPNLILIKINRI